MAATPLQYVYRLRELHQLGSLPSPNQCSLCNFAHLYLPILPYGEVAIEDSQFENICVDNRSMPMAL